MSRSDERANHSGFAQFDDQDARARFVQAVLDRAPKLKRRAYLSASRPTIVFDKLTTTERDKIIAALAGEGHWFEDVPFQTFP
jgi:hypothetical protein